MSVPDRLRIGGHRIDRSEPCATCGEPLGDDCHAEHAAFIHFACEHRWLTATATSGTTYRRCRICGHAQAAAPESPMATTPPPPKEGP